MSSAGRIPALEANVVCPFFKSCTPGSVRCEGVDSGSTMAFIYPSPRSGMAKGVIKRMGAYCSSKYRSCHHFREMMYNKYGDGERKGGDE